MCNERFTSNVLFACISVILYARTLRHPEAPIAVLELAFNDAYTSDRIDIASSTGKLFKAVPPFLVPTTTTPSATLRQAQQIANAGGSAKTALQLGFAHGHT
jgi:hypothetical protein